MGGRFGEILLLVIVAMLLFGPQKLPDLAKAMGEAMREFKKAANGEGTPAVQAQGPQGVLPALLDVQASTSPNLSGIKKTPKRRARSTRSRA